MGDNLPPLSERQALQARGEHPAPCARQCEAQAFRSEIAAEQRRCEMYVDLVRRTAEALGLTREDGWHDLPERVRALQIELAAAIKDRRITEDATADEVHVLRAEIEALKLDATIDNARSKE